MTINEMLVVINNEAGRPIVKDGGKKILANPYKFICEGDEYVLYRNVEKIGMTEVLRTTDEDKACRIFIKELEALSISLGKATNQIETISCFMDGNE